MSWKPQVEVDGGWHSNALVFATEQEAKDYAENLFRRWTLTTGHRAVQSGESVNYRYLDGQLEPIT